MVSSDFNTHCEILSIVGKRLTDARLTINLDKSKFCFKELRYLGYIVGGGTLRTDPTKIKAILRI